MGLLEKGESMDDIENSDLLDFIRDTNNLGWSDGETKQWSLRIVLAVGIIIRS